MDYKAQLHSRLDYREKELDGRIAKLRRQIDQGVLGGEGDRLWLDEQVKGLECGLRCGVWRFSYTRCRRC